MHSARRSKALFALLAMSILTVTSCGTHHETTSPIAAMEQTDEAALGGRGSQQGFYPLASGNHWEHEILNVSVLTPNVGDPTRVEYRFFPITDQTCIEARNGKSYLIERIGLRGGRPSLWHRYRQDKHGLYLADDFNPACETTPSLQRESPDPEVTSDPLREACAAKPAAERAAWLAAVDRIEERRDVVALALDRSMDPHGRRREPPPGELLRLSYPLHKGATWTSQREPLLVTCRVEGAETLQTPAGRLSGYRIRVTYDILGRLDRVTVWYGRQGYLGSHAHYVSDATNQDGHVVGTVVVDIDESLTRFSLVRSNL